MAEQTNGKVAKQTFKTAKECKRVIRFAPSGKCEVDGKTVDELSSSVYIDKQVLEHLGNPEKVVVTVSAGSVEGG